MECNLISIVLPVYNGEKHLAQSIESVINQTYSNWELIVVNDCSTDKTKEIVEKYLEKDNRIKLINNTINLKLPNSLNVGFDNAKGEYYTWTSDDNLYKPNALEYMLKVLKQKQEIALISCQFDVIDEDGMYKEPSSNWFKTRTLRELLDINNIGACFMYRASVAKKVGKYDPDTFLAEDYDYWFRIAYWGDVYYSEENLYKYRTHKKSLSTTKASQVRVVARRVRLKHVKNLATKLGLSKNEIYKLLFEVKYIAKIKEILKNIFNVSREGERKVITFIGIKIKFKKKRKCDKSAAEKKCEGNI